MKTRNSHGLLQLGREALAYCQCASALISGNKALFASVDLIGEKNQVILECIISTTLQASLMICKLCTIGWDNLEPISWKSSTVSYFIHIKTVWASILLSMQQIKIYAFVHLISLQNIHILTHRQWMVSLTFIFIVYDYHKGINAHGG